MVEDGYRLYNCLRCHCQVAAFRCGSTTDCAAGQVCVDGLCEQACPEVFKVDGDGIAHVILQVCTSCKLQEVADQCPVNSIKVS